MRVERDVSCKLLVGIVGESWGESWLYKRLTNYVASRFGLHDLYSVCMYAYSIYSYFLSSEAPKKCTLSGRWFTCSGLMFYESPPKHRIPNPATEFRV